jgi:hypothetical protein
MRYATIGIVGAGPTATVGSQLLFEASTLGADRVVSPKVSNAERFGCDHGQARCHGLWELLRQIVPATPDWRSEMSIRKHTEPWTGHPREPDEFQHLINLEEDSRGGTIWPWIAGIIAVIVLLTLVYGYSRKISTMARTLRSSSSSATSGAAPTTPPKRRSSGPSPALK